MIIPTAISLACAVIHKVLPEASDHRSVILKVGHLFMLEWISFALIPSLKGACMLEVFALVNDTEPALA